MEKKPGGNFWREIWRKEERVMDGKMAGYDVLT